MCIPVMHVVGEDTASALPKCFFHPKSFPWSEDTCVQIIPLWTKRIAPTKYLPMIKQMLDRQNPARTSSQLDPKWLAGFSPLTASVSKWKIIKRDAVFACVIVLFYHDSCVCSPLLCYKLPLLETNIAPENRRPKRKPSYSKHPFSGATVHGSEIGLTTWDVTKKPDINNGINYKLLPVPQLVSLLDFQGLP